MIVVGVVQTGTGGGKSFLTHQYGYGSHTPTACAACAHRRRLWLLQGIQNAVVANAVRCTPEQLAKALAAALAEVEELRGRQRGQLEQGQEQPSGEGGIGASSEVPAVAVSAGGEQARGGKGGGGGGRGKRWLLVVALQLAGLSMYFGAVQQLGCAA